MPRARDPNRDKAFELFKNSSGDIKLKDIAAQLGISEGTVRGWKNKDDWTAKLNGTFQTKIRNVPNKKRGGQPGNKNAKGNSGGAPKQNTNSFKHGLFAKYLPKETLEIVYQMDGISPVDILWMNIELQFAQIVRAQQIMHVESIDDKTKELKRQKESDKGWEKEWEIQFAWDKHASFLTAVSKAISSLNSLIKQFDEMANADDERRLKLEQMGLNIQKTKAEIKKISGDEDDDHEDDGFLEALNGQVSEVWNDEEN